MREDPANFAGSTFRGEALKGRSEGSWRSGRRRSGDVGGGGTVINFVYSVSCRLSLEHLACQNIADCQFPIAKWPLRDQIGNGQSPIGNALQFPMVTCR